MNDIAILFIKIFINEIIDDCYQILYYKHRKYHALHFIGYQFMSTPIKYLEFNTLGIFLLFISLCACTQPPPKSTFVPPPVIKKSLPPLPQETNKDRINPNEDPSVLPAVKSNVTSH